jgi:hypothetical protein
MENNKDFFKNDNQSSIDNNNNYDNETNENKEKNKNNKNNKKTKVKVYNLKKLQEKSK